MESTRYRIFRNINSLILSWDTCTIAAKISMLNNLLTLEKSSIFFRFKFYVTASLRELGGYPARGITVTNLKILFFSKKSRDNNETNRLFWIVSEQQSCSRISKLCRSETHLTFFFTLLLFNLIETSSTTSLPRSHRTTF